MAKDIDKNFKKLLDLPDDEPVESTEVANTTDVTKPASVEEFIKLFDRKDVNKDYKKIRETYDVLLSKGKDAIDDMMDLAKQSDNPRAYEVLGNLIKNICDVADRAVELQKSMKDLDGETTEGDGPSTINNTAVFFGSAGEVLNILKETQKKLIIAADTKVSDALPVIEVKATEVEEGNNGSQTEKS